jgi:hypothetical protein
MPAERADQRQRAQPRAQERTNQEFHLAISAGANWALA